MCQDTLAGLVTHTPDWRDELAWLREAGDQGIAIFENAAERRGVASRRNCVAMAYTSSAVAPMEIDLRTTGPSPSRSCGILVSRLARSMNSQSPERAIAFLDEHPGRYVVKFNGRERELRRTA